MEHQPAPDFELPATGGSVFKMSDYQGRGVVLYFYPKDDTAGCTAQACQFRDMLPSFSDSESIILGLSRDSMETHQKFRKKYALTFPLLVDETGEVCQKYGVWIEKSMYGRKYFGIERTTFLIDPHGIIRRIWPKVIVTGHAETVLKAIKE